MEDMDERDGLLPDDSFKKLAPLAFSSIVEAPIRLDDESEDVGPWGPTIQLLRKIGAKSICRLGLGLGASFEKFSVETQVYPTRGVVAMSSNERFKLSDAVKEPRVFSIYLSAEKQLEHNMTPLLEVRDIGFGPMPDRVSGLDELELARRYAVVLATLLEKRPYLVNLKPDDSQLIENSLLSLLPPE